VARMTDHSLMVTRNANMPPQRGETEP
jgi:hypothetical protein